MIIHQGPVAYAKLPRDQKGFLAFSRNMQDKRKGNTALPSPSPSLAAFGADVDAFDTALTKAKDGTPTAVTDRDAKALKVHQDIGHIIDYVQSVADTQASAADAIAVIVSAGLQVKKTSTHKKPELAVKYTGLSGEVLLAALAIAGAGAYYWEFSLDQKAWTTAPETTIGKTTVAGLTPGQVYYFRFRALTKKGKSDYSQVVSLIMH